MCKLYWTVLASIFFLTVKPPSLQGPAPSWCYHLPTQTPLPLIRSSHTYLLLSSVYFLVSTSYKSLGDIQNIRDTTPDLCEQNRISSQVSSYFFCIQRSLLLCASEKCQSATTKTNVKIIVDVIKKLNPIQVHVHVNFISNVFSTP